MANHEYTLIDGGAYGVSIVAHIEYGIEMASGNGRDEPRDPGGPYIISVSLEKIVRSRRMVGYGHDGQPVWHYRTTSTAIEGEAPEWVSEVLEDVEWWTEIDCEPHDDGDYLYDTMRDRQLVEGSL